MGTPAVGEMLAALRLRQKTRSQWRMREEDPAFAKLTAECAPIKVPLFTAAANSPLFEDLSDSITTLEGHRETLAIIWVSRRYSTADILCESCSQFDLLPSVPMDTIRRILFQSRKKGESSRIAKS